MRTLRSRLILSHILPLVLLLPVVGFALTHLLETQVLLAGFSDELARYGALSAEMAGVQPAIWSDTAEAERFVTVFSIRRQYSVMLIDPDGRLLAASEPGYDGQRGQPIVLPDLSEALAGQQTVYVGVPQGVQTEVVQVLVPVWGPNQELKGVVRMSEQLSDVQGELNRLRYVTAGVLAAAMVLAIVVGLLLALSLGRRLQRVSNAINGVAAGREWTTLPEEGPEEIRTLLRAFNTLIERLRVLEESRRRLLANLVHELGRPLGALQSAIHALLGGADEEPELRHEMLEGMQSQVQRLRPLLDSLTDLHTQVLGTLELHLQPTPLGEWLRGMATPWREVAHAQGLQWQADIPDSLPVLDIDRDRLAQALGNLLSNAIRYTPEGTVSVDASVEEGFVCITVGDTGIGIDPAEQSKIFEPFYRSQRDVRFPQGMGLGLSIARDLVEAHGGSLGVESAPNEGSRFTIRLPLETSES
jgi:two-component system sensor histidine kinase BaeS